MINRLKNKGKRFKLSYDGQVLRIINLPKNYKDYPYILASFPNSYYEKKMWYTKQRTKNDLTPAKTAKLMSDEDKDLICEKVKKNLKLRLNIDYRKSLTSDWKEELSNTYRDTSLNRSLNAYVKAAKSRKMVASSSQIVVDPSSLWTDKGGSSCYVRVYTKFRVKSGQVPSAKSSLQNEVIYGSYTAMKNLSSKKTVTFMDEIKVNISYTNGKMTSYGVDWGGIV